MAVHHLQNSSRAVFSRFQGAVPFLLVTSLLERAPTRGAKMHQMPHKDSETRMSDVVPEVRASAIHELVVSVRFAMFPLALGYHQCSYRTSSDNAFRFLGVGRSAE
jgi:hypothetical protein